MGGSSCQASCSLPETVLFHELIKLYLGGSIFKFTLVSLEIKGRVIIPFLGSHFQKGSRLESQPSALTFLSPYCIVDPHSNSVQDLDRIVCVLSTHTIDLTVRVIRGRPLF